MTLNSKRNTTKTSALGGNIQQMLSPVIQTGFTTPYAHNHHEYIYEPIGQPSEYIHLVEMLNTASPYDVIHLHLNTPGGYLNTAISIIHAIQTTHATVLGYADGEVASAGTLILLSCHQFMISPYSHMMIHDGSYGPIGKFSEVHAMATHSTKQLRLICKDIYGVFLKKKEIDNVLLGIDMYFDAKDMEKRLTKLMKYRDKIQKESQEQEE